MRFILMLFILLYFKDLNNMQYALIIVGFASAITFDILEFLQ